MNLVIQSGTTTLTSVDDVNSVNRVSSQKTTQAAATSSELIIIKQGNRAVLELPLQALDPIQTAKLTQLLESVNSTAFNNNIGTAVDSVQKELSAFLATMGMSGNSEIKASNKGPLADLFELMILLFQLAKDNRELNIAQRDIATTASVASIRAQASELRSAKGALIAMAVVSGVLAVTSAVMAVKSTSTSTQHLRESSKVNSQLGQQQKFKDTLNSLHDEGKHVSSALRGTDADIGKLTRQNFEIDTLLRTRDSSAQARNTVLQGVGQISNNIGNVYQTGAQASQKEEEAEGTLAQAEKQKADDRIGYDDNFLKEVRDLLRAIGESYNQAWKAASIPA
ncbi:type III secretion system translocon subunit SctB [Shewanella sp.]|uniref:type III secretion system translocon subunit SctB n=1 Tax=Shewanella sp. TaxID=50422 RepID=UPI001EB52BEF|nr:type III secretion system translocon subunit SctB [Shewanella sp.]NRB24688.1 type III secretion system translocon subunit SctB [Shewanella sp.]